MLSNKKICRHSGPLRPLYATWFGYIQGKLTGHTAPDPEEKNSSQIHNPTIRYFQKILSKIGKSDNTYIISKKELFIIFCVFQSRPVHSTTFLLFHLNKMDKQRTWNIYFCGLITSITLSVSLWYPFARLVSLGGITSLDIDLCITQVRIHQPNQLYLMIINEVVKHIILNLEKTNVQDVAM